MEITEMTTKWKTFPLASKQNKQEKKIIKSTAISISAVMQTKSTYKEHIVANFSFNKSISLRCYRNMTSFGYENKYS